MSGRQRMVVLAVGVVLVACFVAGLLNPGGRGDGGPGDGEGGLVGLLGGWVGEPAGADPEELAADCQEPDGRLVFGGSCTIEVAPADQDLRQVRLTAQHPVTVTAPPPREESQVDTELAAGETVQVAVGPEGAEIELDCHASDDCVVVIGEGDG